MGRAVFSKKTKNALYKDDLTYKTSKASMIYVNAETGKLYDDPTRKAPSRVSALCPHIADQPKVRRKFLCLGHCSGQNCKKMKQNDALKCRDDHKWISGCEQPRSEDKPSDCQSRSHCKSKARSYHDV